MAARKLRHDFLARAARQRKIRTIALAHHADDQVELFFLRLLRGAGGEGLAGMKWRNAFAGEFRNHAGAPVARRIQGRAACLGAREKIPFREDATNAQLDIQRNRVRHELLPLLTRHYQPALAQVVLRQMDILGAEADFVEQAAQDG